MIWVLKKITQLAGILNNRRFVLDQHIFQGSTLTSHCEYFQLLWTTYWKRWISVSHAKLWIQEILAHLKKGKWLLPWMRSIVVQALTSFLAVNSTKNYFLIACMLSFLNLFWAKKTKAAFVNSRSQFQTHKKVGFVGFLSQCGTTSRSAIQRRKIGLMKPSPPSSFDAKAWALLIPLETSTLSGLLFHRDWLCQLVMWL